MSVSSPDRITFLVVGCQRCGTTWLDAALREHPQVYLPATKQSYFFDRHFNRGAEWWLERFSDDAAERIAVGEVATGYSLADAVPRMASLVPHVKLIMAVRNPIERAYSNFLTRRAEQGWVSFEDALAREPDLLERGKYIEQIEAILRHYPRERFLLKFYDDFAQDNRSYFQEILGFIGVDTNFESSQFGRRRNAAMFSRLRSALHKVGLKPALVALSRSGAGDVVRRLNNQRRTPRDAGIDPQLRAKLVDMFRPFNDRLGEFAGRDLSTWNR